MDELLIKIDNFINQNDDFLNEQITNNESNDYYRGYISGSLQAVLSIKCMVLEQIIKDKKSK